jgi:hypothetical protein
VKVVLVVSDVNLFSRMPCAFGGSRKLGAGMSTSIVSVEPDLAGSGRWWDRLLRCDLCLRRGVCLGVVYGSWLLPARTVGGGGAGFEGRPDEKPKFSLGVRSHMLLILGVRP